MVTPDESTINQGHRVHDLSSAADKRPVCTNLGLAQFQTLVTGHFGILITQSCHLDV